MNTFEFMARKSSVGLVLALSIFLFQQPVVLAQLAPEVAEFGYADTIF